MGELSLRALGALGFALESLLEAVLVSGDAEEDDDAAAFLFARCSCCSLTRKSSTVVPWLEAGGLSETREGGTRASTSLLGDLLKFVCIFRVVIMQPTRAHVWDGQCAT